MRKGLGKGQGMGYKNIVPKDPHIHSLSARGIKSVDYTGVVIPKMKGLEPQPDSMIPKLKAKGRECDECGCALQEEDYWERGKWSYTCPKCGFRYNHERGLNAKTLKDVPPSERYKVGKQIMGWDEYEVGEAEIQYRLENWKDAGYDTKPTEEQVRNDVYEDSDIYTWVWDDLMENLKESMQKKNPNGYWRAEVKNFGWRSQSGEAEPFYTEDPAELLRKILPDTQNTFKIFNFGKGYAIQNYHHDSPTGREWYYVVPISDTEYEQLREW